MNQYRSGDELSPEEAAAFLALPREVAGTDQLAEERTVRALRDAGLLVPHQRSRTNRLLAIGGAIAAALVIFAAGALYGRRIAAHDVESASPAIDVQQAGTAYVAALVRLSRASDTERAPGFEAGAATLRAAATSLVMVNPNDSIAHRIRKSLNEDNHYAGDRTVIWY